MNRGGDGHGTKRSVCRVLFCHTVFPETGVQTYKEMVAQETSEISCAAVCDFT
jgi:hypothetical protein